MTNPKLISTPFAENGVKNDIPLVTGAEPQNATMNAGFPDITQQPLPQGIPPERADFNGLGYLTTSHLAFLNKGNWYGFDSTFASQIGGYGLNARLQLDNGDIVKSTVNGNTTNPNTDMTGWVKDGGGETVESIADLPTSANDGDVVYVKGYYKPTNLALAQPYIGGGTRIYVASRKAENDGFLCINGWVLTGVLVYTPDIAGAKENDVTLDTQALLKLFALARIQVITINFTRMYKSNSELVCYAVQTHNKGITITADNLDCGIEFVGNISNKALIDIHSYNAVIDGIKVLESTDNPYANFGIRICGENVRVSNPFMRGKFKKAILAVSALKSKIENFDIRVGLDSESQYDGVGVQLSACVNTGVSGTSFVGRSLCPLVCGVLDGEDINALKPPSMTENISWGCEGVQVSGVKSVWAHIGMILKGLELQVVDCVLDFNIDKFLLARGQMIKITDSWYATSPLTADNAEMMDISNSSYLNITGNTFDGGQSTSRTQTVTLNSSYSTHTNNLTNLISGIIDGSNMSIGWNNRNALGTAPWRSVNPDFNTIFSNYGGKPLFANGLKLGVNSTDTNAKLIIRTDSGETGIEQLTAVGTILKTGRGGLAYTAARPDDNAVLHIGNNTASGRSIAATGTINASGADYAEYIRKSKTCGTVKAGDVIGINSNGEITQRFSESISFAVKSTNPSIVGGDDWANDIVSYPADLTDDATDDEKKAYDDEVQKWKINYDLVRQKYDRVAFCGQTPINLKSNVGEYVIAICGENDTISVLSINNPTFEQFLKCIGKTIKVIDGVPHIIVFNN